MPSREILHDFEAGKTYTQKYQRVDRSLGRYLTLAAIACEYGFSRDPEAALRSATSYCTKCARVGGAWATFDRVADAMMFLFIQVV
eukprot:12696322-Alexandrium_andersonii.AAC.1